MRRRPSSRPSRRGAAPRGAVSDTADDDGSLHSWVGRRTMEYDARAFRSALQQRRVLVRQRTRRPPRGAAAQRVSTPPANRLERAAMAGGGRRYIRRRRAKSHVHVRQPGRRVVAGGLAAGGVAHGGTPWGGTMWAGKGMGRRSGAHLARGYTWAARMGGANRGRARARRTAVAARRRGHSTVTVRARVRAGRLLMQGERLMTIWWIHLVKTTGMGRDTDRRAPLPRGWSARGSRGAGTCNLLGRGTIVDVV